jgi:hypothetical protein
MAQEASTQTVRVQKPFRDTAYGGYTKAWIISAGGQVVKPTRSERSKSGTHGWDIWQLPAGRYAVITVDRPNLKNGPRPFTVRLQCINISNGEVKVLNTKTMYVMRVSMSDLKEWAKAICPPS